MAQPPYVLNRNPPSAESLAIAAEELRETPEIVAKALEELKQLLKNDDTIHFRDDDEFLMIFLRPCKFYAESAYALMKRIAEFKKKNHELLDNLMPEDERESFTNHKVVNVLTDRDHLGRRVLVVNTGALWDPSKVTTDSIFRMFYLIHQAALLEPESQIRGVVVIMDYEGLGMKQVRAFSPTFSFRLLSFIQDAMPLRLKEVHMVKQPYIFNLVWTMFKPFIKEKLGKRIHFHGSKMASLHKFMDPSCLPENYGGKLPAINYSGKEWFPCIEEFDDHFRAMNTYGFVKK